MTCGCDDGKIWNNADPTSGQWVPCDCISAATKGPWFVKETPVLAVVCQEDWPVICEITSLGDRPGYDGDEFANARLIAAAPELLELAHQYVSDLRHPMSDDSRQRRIERALQVIALATGEPK